MERKIGEIFEFGGEWYQCLEQPKDYIDNVCKACDFSGRGNCELDKCSGTYRNDKKSVIFKKLEKVGEPITVTRKCYGGEEGNYVEIKTKEDMEEKKLNLKPFDLQKAREGKPVCTRNGRKARIICFDAKGKQPIIALFEREKSDEVIIQTYNDDGSYYGLEKEDDRDLMMLPEKKEAWVNLYPCDCMGQKRYPTKEEALKNAVSDVIATVKIEWEE